MPEEYPSFVTVGMLGFLQENLELAHWERESLSADREARVSGGGAGILPLRSAH